MTTNQHQYIYYGTKANTVEIEKFVLHTLAINKQAKASNRKKTPVCIWGKHGIGKTELVESIAKEHGYKFTYIAPAQFEEMGDLLGMPKIVDNETITVAPSWVPTVDQPGILLIDDVNRADDRILRGIMQLLQNHELASWKLPEQWHIILTANPDGGDYSVTPMDDAMLTRMLHITAEFDLQAWAEWALKKGVDQRGVNFVLTYPEIVTGQRTTPRSLVQFFTSIAGIKDLKKELPLVRMLADSCLDANASAAFISFVQQNQSKLISPEEIINTKKFAEDVEAHLNELVIAEHRIDILATLCTRLTLYLKSLEKKCSKAQLENVKLFLKMEIIPNDIRLSMLGDLTKTTSVKSILLDPALSKLLLQKM
ncbi:AAA family ATPase [Psychroserpens sp. NJDZ02]|uniref:AAA family ATPase n=1 Tax=Psychroserpens sp. NJDZ02 TaxID=2570561 RepID=UPI00197F8E53|nr:AAA family ATPase [Psychroserpens sp. NJDZ02]